MNSEKLTEPPIRYARTSDGLNIAFWTLGEGPALVQMPGFPWSHIRLEWRYQACRDYYQRLASERTFVRYDCRGAGLSERMVDDLSIDGHLRDLEAVVDKAGIERFSLMGVTHLGPAAITYAIRHPERVTHLILWCSYARSSDMSESPRVDAGRALLDRDWEMYTELGGWRVAEGVDEAEARQYTAYLQDGASALGVKAAFEAMRAYEVTDLLSQVSVPTLVIHRKDSRVLGRGVARSIASRIPNARLTMLSGRSLAPFLEDVDAAVGAIVGFLSDGGRSEANPDGLSSREIEVLGLVAAGRSNRQIAVDLLLSERTVSRHITNVYTKIGAHSRAEATAYAIRRNLA